MNSKIISVLISLVFIVLTYFQVFVPHIRFDTISLVFILMASLPWLSPYLKSLQLPGGLKIELKDTKLATDKILQNLEDAGTPVVSAETKVPNSGRDENNETGQVEIFRSMASTDPNLAFIGFRIEVEKKIRLLARKYDLNESPSVSRIIRALEKKNILSKALATGLLELLTLGNHAAHGARVSDDAADWVLKSGPAVLKILQTL